MDALVPLARELIRHDVRFIVIGVAGANYWALGGSTLFTTRDRDLFLPPDVDTILKSWAACEAVGLQLYSGLDPLDSPRDRWLAERILERRAAVRATDGDELHVDLSLVMAGFDFETVWAARRNFMVDGLAIPVARLSHVVASKHAAGRDKDKLFLATHRDALKQLLTKDAG